MNKLDELLKQILEVNNLPEFTTSDGLPHPLAYLLMSNENCIDSSNHRQYVCRNSKNSLRLIYKKDKSFFTSQKIKSLVGSNINNASATLREIRCYGTLLEKFDKSIRHVPEKQNLKSTDFIIDFEG